MAAILSQPQNVKWEANFYYSSICVVCAVQWIVYKIWAQYFVSDRAFNQDTIL